MMKTLRDTAFAADKELIAPMMAWRFNGQPAGNGWTAPANNAVFETMYFYTESDTQLRQLAGESSYTITFR